MFKDSKLAHKMLDEYETGLEVGNAPWNPYHITAKMTYVDLFDRTGTVGENDPFGNSGTYRTDIIAPGDNIPVPDNSFDFVLGSHVLEHFWDPIKALLEWKRIAKYKILFMLPKIEYYECNLRKERDFDPTFRRTTLKELISRHSGKIPIPEKYAKKDYQGTAHLSHWTLEDMIELCEYLNLKIIATQDPDDKVGNGFVVVIETGEK